MLCPPHLALSTDAACAQTPSRLLLHHVENAESWVDSREINVHLLLLFNPGLLPPCANRVNGRGQKKKEKKGYPPPPPQKKKKKRRRKKEETE